MKTSKDRQKERQAERHRHTQRHTDSQTEQHKELAHASPVSRSENADAALAGILNEAMHDLSRGRRRRLPPLPHSAVHWLHLDE